MRILKRTFFILVVLFLFLGANGQSYLNYPDSWMTPVPEADKYYNDSVNQLNVPKSKMPPLKFSLNLGTSFSTSGYYGSGVQTWVAPEINYRVSDKLNLRMGVVATNNYMNSLPYGSSEVGGVNTSGSWFNYKVYVSADYFVSEKLVVSGSLLKSIDQTPAWVGQSPYFSQNYESMSMSFQYRINDFMTVGGGIQIDRGNVPYYYNPMQPFGNHLSPFGPY